MQIGPARNNICWFRQIGTGGRQKLNHHYTQSCLIPTTDRGRPRHDRKLCPVQNSGATILNSSRCLRHKAPCSPSEIGAAGISSGNSAQPKRQNQSSVARVTGGQNTRYSSRFTRYVFIVKHNSSKNVLLWGELPMGHAYPFNSPGLFQQPQRLSYYPNILSPQLTWLSPPISSTINRLASFSIVPIRFSHLDSAADPI